MQYRVLIVEDGEGCAAPLEIAFAAIPQVEVAVTTSALDALRRMQSADSVSALVTDLNMPRMDGFELIERVRADHRLRSLPIIVISGDTDPGTPARLRHLGADAYFPKPCSPAEVRSKLEQLLHASHSQQQGESPAVRA